MILMDRSDAPGILRGEMTTLSLSPASKDFDVACLMVEAALSGVRFDRLVVSDDVPVPVVETLASRDEAADKAFDIEMMYAFAAEAAYSRCEDAYYAQESWLAGGLCP